MYSNVSRETLPLVGGITQDNVSRETFGYNILDKICETFCMRCETNGFNIKSKDTEEKKRLECVFMQPPDLVNLSEQIQN